MKTGKSKKDLAFDKERAKYRHEISALQREIKENLREIEVLNQKILELEESIRQKDDWINRLLEYTELTELQMKYQIQKDKSALEFNNLTKELCSIVWRFGKLF